MKLRDYLHFERKKIAEIAEKADCSVPYLCLIVNEKKVPSKKMARWISQATGGVVQVSDLISQQVVS